MKQQQPTDDVLHTSTQTRWWVPREYSLWTKRRQTGRRQGKRQDEEDGYEEKKRATTDGHGPWCSASSVGIRMAGVGATARGASLARDKQQGQRQRRRRVETTSMAFAVVWRGAAAGRYDWPDTSARWSARQPRHSGLAPVDGVLQRMLRPGASFYRGQYSGHYSAYTAAPGHDICTPTTP